MDNQINKIANQNHIVKNDVLKMLGITNEMYCEFQEQKGYEYLQKEMNLMPHYVKELSYSKAFWNWWKNQWIIRDINFLGDVIRYGTVNSIYSSSRIKNTYAKYHTPDALFFAAHEEKLRKSYSHLISIINKNAIHG